jgi:hypothetical protein
MNSLLAYSSWDLSPETTDLDILISTPISVINLLYSRATSLFHITTSSPSTE